MKAIHIACHFVIAAILVHLVSLPANAHPLGNFTINHHAGLNLSHTGINIFYILDMAEIPAFQKIAEFDKNGNNTLDSAEVAAVHPAVCTYIRDNVVLQIDGQPVSLAVKGSTVAIPSGVGGLPTLRLSCSLDASVNQVDEDTKITFETQVYTERLGWREIVIQAQDLVLPDNLAKMTVSPTKYLTDYPDNLLDNPLDQRKVSFIASPMEYSDTNPAQVSDSRQSTTSLPEQDQFTQLITMENVTLPSILLALAVAFVWGAAHALTPGHGKTIVAAYLVGSRGTTKHALFLGLTTTITHTLGVFILGLITLFASQFIIPEKLYPWLGVASGVLVVWIGLTLFWGRLSHTLGLNLSPEERDHRLLHQHNTHHTHSHDHHAHHHHHHHHPGSGQGHTHIPPVSLDRDDITWRGLVALGVSGGLIPCPSALIVMLSAIALQRIGLGLALILVFSLGLAGVLTAIGIVWVQARRLVEQTPKWMRLFQGIRGQGKLFQALPALSALFIAVIGVGITVRALLQTGML